MNQRKNRKEKVYDGSSFNSFLNEERIREEVEVNAIKRVLAWQLERAAREQQKRKQMTAKELLAVNTKRV